MAYESIKCTGYSTVDSGEDVTYDVIVKMSRADVREIERFVQFAAEQSNQYGFIRDCVRLVDRWHEVLTEHTRLVNEDSDDL